MSSPKLEAANGLFKKDAIHFAWLNCWSLKMERVF